MPPCSVQPFADASAADRASLIGAACGGEHIQWKLDSPRAKPTDPGPSLMKAEFNTVASERFDSLLGTLKFDWAGMRSESSGTLRTERMALAAGGLVKLGDAWWWQMNLGRELTGVPRTRAVMSGIWQPVTSGLLFAEWAGSGNRTEANRVGGRWWLMRGKLAVDFGARYLPDGSGWADHNIGLTLDLAR